MSKPVPCHDDDAWPYRVWLSEVMLQQTTVAAVPHDVINAELSRNLGRPVNAAVVDDQHFDLIDAVDRFRQRTDCLLELLGFVETRDLDDQLHGSPSPGTPTRPLTRAWVRRLDFDKFVRQTCINPLSFSCRGDCSPDN